MSNNNLVLISGKPAQGKSASFKDFIDPKGVMYLNCESGKKLPFKSKFLEFTITDPMQIIEAFAEAEAMPEIHTIIIDSLTFLMEMYESQYVATAADGRKAWGDYAQFYKGIFQSQVPKSTKNIIFTGHASDIVSEDMIKETKVQIKGSIMKIGVEASFSTVVMAKRVPLKMLKDTESDLLNITEDDEILGYKNVFQVKNTKATVNDSIRAPMDMWGKKEFFIDNNSQALMNRLVNFYKDDEDE